MSIFFYCPWHDRDEWTKQVKEKFTRNKKICSRCGKGVYMSEHKNRRTCGKCANTEFIQ